MDSSWFPYVLLALAAVCFIAARALWPASRKAGWLRAGNGVMSIPFTEEERQWLARVNGGESLESVWESMGVYATRIDIVTVPAEEDGGEPTQEERESKVFPTRIGVQKVPSGVQVMFNVPQGWQLGVGQVNPHSAGKLLYFPGVKTKAYLSEEETGVLVMEMVSGDPLEDNHLGKNFLGWA